MSREHFRMLAENLHAEKPTCPIRKRQWDSCVFAVARACKEENPRFDYDRFYAACENGVR